MQNSLCENPGSEHMASQHRAFAVRWQALECHGIEPTGVLFALVLNLQKILGNGQYGERLNRSQGKAHHKREVPFQRLPDKTFRLLEIEHRSHDRPTGRHSLCHAFIYSSAYCLFGDSHIDLILK